MPDTPTIPDLAATLMDRCDELATHTEVPGTITRRYGTPALSALADHCQREGFHGAHAWCRIAGGWDHVKT